VIFCAGDFTGLATTLGEKDYIIAADGGLTHTQRLGLTPNYVMGDFDSLGYVPENAATFPVEKDDTDAMLAVRHGLKLGYRQFLLYGSLDGPRLDHTVANFQTLQFLADHGAVGYLIGKTQMVTVVQNETVTFPTGTTGILSIFCLGADAEGVSLSGLKYNLENAALTAGFPLGVSNHFTTQEAKISVENGSLLLIYDRENGFPTRQRRDRL
jgi:thiamine pyrophosphokinase